MDSRYNYSEEEKEEISIEENIYEFSWDEDEVSNKNNKKNTRLYTIKSKLKVIAYSEPYNKIEAAKHFVNILIYKEQPYTIGLKINQNF